MTSHRAFATALTVLLSGGSESFSQVTSPGKVQQQGLTSVLFLLQHSVGMLVAYWDSIEQEALQPDSRILLPTSKNLGFKFVHCFMVISRA